MTRPERGSVGRPGGKGSCPGEPVRSDRHGEDQGSLPTRPSTQTLRRWPWRRSRGSPASSSMSRRVCRPRRSPRPWKQVTWSASSATVRGSIRTSSLTTATPSWVTTPRRRCRSSCSIHGGPVSAGSGVWEFVDADGAALEANFDSWGVAGAAAAGSGSRNAVPSADSPGGGRARRDCDDPHRYRLAAGRTAEARRRDACEQAQFSGPATSLDRPGAAWPGPCRSPAATITGTLPWIRWPTGTWNPEVVTSRGNPWRQAGVSLTRPGPLVVDGWTASSSRLASLVQEVSLLSGDPESRLSFSGGVTGTITAAVPNQLTDRRRSEIIPKMLSSARLVHKRVAERQH